MNSSGRCREVNPGGLSHSEIHGSAPACGSPWLIATCYVLHRLLAPRHSPFALSSLITKFLPLPPASLRRPASRETQRIVFLPYLSMLMCSCQRTPPASFPPKAFNPERSATGKSSKPPPASPGWLVGVTGLEPVTLRLSSACSNQLSYTPNLKSQISNLKSQKVGGAEEIRTPDL